MANETVQADHFLVVGGNHWAKDKNLKTAFFNWLVLSNAKRAIKVSVLMVDADAGVDEMGTLHAKVSKELPDIEVPAAVIDALLEPIEIVEDAS